MGKYMVDGKIHQKFFLHLFSQRKISKSQWEKIFYFYFNFNYFSVNVGWILLGSNFQRPCGKFSMSIINPEEILKENINVVMDFSLVYK